MQKTERIIFDRALALSSKLQSVEPVRVAWVRKKLMDEGRWKNDAEVAANTRHYLQVLDFLTMKSLENTEERHNLPASDYWKFMAVLLTFSKKSDFPFDFKQEYFENKRETVEAEVLWAFSNSPLDAAIAFVKDAHKSIFRITDSADSLFHSQKGLAIDEQALHIVIHAGVSLGHMLSYSQKILEGYISKVK